jgi:uncharacterized protein (TIGR04222 family)
MLGPFDLPGPDFLLLYAALFVAASAAAFVIPLMLRPEGRRQRLTDVEQLAYLAGGETRFDEAVVARLLAAGSLAMRGRKGFVATGAHPPASRMEEGVLSLPAPIRWRDIQDRLNYSVYPLKRRLVAAGLLMTKEAYFRLRLQAVSPFLLLLMFGAIKLGIGAMRERPVGYLTAMLMGTVLAALLVWRFLSRRTRAGAEAVAQAGRAAARLRLAPTDNEAALAVALFGATVLVGSGWSDFAHLRRGTGGGGDGGGGCGGGDGGGCGGGSGCGGGGCGGCGG